MEDIEREFIELDIPDNNDPETYWEDEDIYGWILDENGNRVVMGFNIMLESYETSSEV